MSINTEETAFLLPSFSLCGHEISPLVGAEFEYNHINGGMDWSNLLGYSLAGKISIHAALYTGSH